MSHRLYRALLWLLPPRRRARFGDDMMRVFDELRVAEQRRRGVLGVTWLWVKEAAGMARFVAREWLAFFGVGRQPRRRGPGVMTELRWAWRGIRGRGWRAAFVVVLLAITFGVNAATFSVADSLIFHRHPYPDADRIVSLDQFVGPERGPNRLQAAALHDAWRAEKDLFSAVGGYFDKTVFLLDNGAMERTTTTDVTIELFEVLGVHPKWGRGFADADLRDTGAFAAIVSEGFARARFGSPARALGQRIDATGRPLIVVGVMPSTFAFPSASTQIWRLMDPAGPLTQNFVGVGLMARVAPSVPPDRLAATLAERAAVVGHAAGLPRYLVTTSPYFVETTSEASNRRRTLLLLLLGSAFAFLLTSCANVASVELAHAVRRAHTHAVQLALGASRVTLARIVAMEGTALVGAAVVAALGTSWVLLRLVSVVLPDWLRLGTQNPIDLDARVVGYLMVLAVVAWVVAALAAVLFMFRRVTLATGNRTIAASKHSARVRRTLTGVQVGLAVALVVVGLLYTRSYQALLGVEKGFDSSGMAVVSTVFPANYFSSRGQSRAAFVASLVDELRHLPGVVGVTNSSPPPHMGDSPSSTTVHVDERSIDVGLGRKWIDTSYFDVMRLPLLSGRYLQAGDSQREVVITETLARRLWPDEEAIGRVFHRARGSQRMESMTVVGVVGDFRTSPVRMPDATDDRAYVYTLTAPVAQSETPPSAVESSWVDDGGAYSGLSITVRVSTLQVLPGVQDAVQRVDPKLSVKLDLVDDIYARQNAETLLATQVVGTFSIVSFVVAMAGLYGVIAFMVASRTREIGIRMALGAAQEDIRRMVLASSGWVVAIGSVAGAAAAFGAARWIESQLFGVSPSDPTTYLVVIGVVAITAVVATWQPARQAASIDPAITLRRE